MSDDSQFAGRHSRVLMVAACPFPARRGTPIRIEKMAEELGRRGNEVHVAAYHLGDPTTNPHFTVHRIRGAASYQNTAPGPTWTKLLVADPRLLGTVYRLAGQLKPDVIHAHHFEGLLVSLPAAVRYRIPLVFDAHVLLDGELEYYDMGMPNGLRSRAARLLDRTLPRLADHVVPVSDEIRQRLHDEHGMSLDSITVVGNGVERPFFEGRKGAYPADGMQRVVFAGNLASYQGVDLLLQAFVHVARARQDVKLTMVTESPTTEFAAQARALGLAERIEFVESDLQRLPDLLASGDVLVNPRTRCPGVPQKLLNYMASGTPVVSFAGSTRYIVDGRSGVVISNDNVEAFAAGILRLLADGTLRSALGAEAKRYAAEKLSWSATAMSLEAVYARLLSERQPRAAQSSTR